MPEPDTTPAAEDIAADLIARCPEHGTRTETWPECRCTAAREAASWLAANHESKPAVGLRGQIAAAIDAVTGGTCPTDIIDAVLAVRDQEMERLRGAVRTLMHAHRDCGRGGEQADTHPPVHRWRVEHVDGAEWVPGSGLKADRAEAVHLLNVGNEIRPLWADGTPVQRRLVRETTSYTAETALAPPADQDRGGQ